MNRVLRSLIYQKPEEKDSVAANHAHVRVERLLSMEDSERAVLEYVVDFFARTGEPPLHRTVYEHFEALQLGNEQALVEVFGIQELREGASFTETFEEVVERRARRNMKAIFQDALEIASTGKEMKKGQPPVQGIQEAVAYTFSTLQPPDAKHGGQLPPDMTENAAALQALYKDRADNPQKAFGVPTGYQLVDKLTGGISRKGLYIHAGFAAHLKSTFLLNQMVNAATDGWDGIYFSDEMAANDLMMMAVAIHSANPEFAGTWEPLHSFKVMKGRLEDDEKKVFDEVQDHLVNTSKHGHIRIYDSGSFTSLGSIQQITAREHTKRPVDIIWIDYVTRLPLDAKYLRAGIDHTTGVNLTIVDAKHFAMGFNQGEGLPVVTAFQINREGLRKGTEAKGKLDARHLGQYNAAEKEGDLITYSWFGEEEQAANEVKVGMIKNRWGPRLPEPVDLFYHAESRLIYERGGRVFDDATKGLDIDEVAVGF